MIGLSIPFLVTRTGGMWLSIGIRVVSVVWACYLVSKEPAEGDRAAS